MKPIVRVTIAIVALSSGCAFAAKPPPSPPPAVGTECVGKTGAFPAIIYSHGVYSGGGRYTKTQFFVANSLGTCAVMVYDTGDYDGFGVEVSFHFDSASRIGTLSWIQTRDNGQRSTGYVIKLARFTVGANNAVQGLPLTAATIYRAPTTPSIASISDVELSPDATRLAFSTNQGGGTVSAPEPQTFQILICTLAGPQNDCLQQEVAFVATSPNRGSGGTGSLTIGHTNDALELERIYFIYRPYPAAYADGDLVSIDHREDGTWTPPQVLGDRDSYMNSYGDADTFFDEPSALSRPGEVDRVLIQTSATFTDSPPRINIYDAASPNTPSAVIGAGYRPSWTFTSSIVGDEGPNVFVGELQHSTNGAIKEIDLNGGSETPVGTISGYSVDSAD